MRPTFHERPSRRFTRYKYTGEMTPYRWGSDGKNGWMIRFGASGFLVAQGVGFSVPHGKLLFHQLESDWLNRRKKRLKK